jgi:enoyl-CoA hydratase
MSADAADDPVLLEREGRIAFLTLNRPDAMNAIDRRMRASLARLVRSAVRDRSVRAIVIRGAGPRAFCAGADIKEFARPASVVGERTSRAGPIWNDLIAASSKPTIAAIHGYCLGGGLEIALACDLRVAAHTAVFGLPEVRLGIIPGAGGTQRLPRIVGIGNALRLILSGDRIDAPEALRIGLVSEVVATGELLAVATDWAERLSAGGPLAVAYAKEAVVRGMELSLHDGLRLEADLATFLTTTDDRAEGAAAFRERRAPAFRGR